MLNRLSIQQQEAFSSLSLSLLISLLFRILFYLLLEGALQLRRSEVFQGHVKNTEFATLGKDAQVWRAKKCRLLC